jgi:hypothetical protein
LLDGLIPSLHIDDVIGDIDTSLQGEIAIVLLTIGCELPPELTTYVGRVGCRWGHVAICEPPDALASVIRSLFTPEAQRTDTNPARPA